MVLPCCIFDHSYYSLHMAWFGLCFEDNETLIFRFSFIIVLVSWTLVHLFMEVDLFDRSYSFWVVMISCGSGFERGYVTFVVLG